MKRSKIDPMQAAAEWLGQLPGGAFLTVRAGDRLNTMTIGWGTLGIVWSRPVFVAAVRSSRYTYRLMEAASDFTVSLPRAGTWRDELTFCGCKSGADVDKFAACKLEAVPAQTVTSPVPGIRGLHLECRMLLRTPMAAPAMAAELAQFYPKNDYHTFYYGEVLASYRLD